MGAALDLQAEASAMVVPSSGEHGVPWGDAGNRICVDFDGTLFPWGPLDGDDPPLDGAREFMYRLREAGYYIIIFSSRLSSTWHSEMGWKLQHAWIAQSKHIMQRLDNYDIPYDDITCEKVPARWYIDDRAIEFRGDWAEVEGKVFVA